MTVKSLKVHCNGCNRETNHEVLHAHTQKWEQVEDRQLIFSGGDTYELVKCRGCDTAALRIQSWIDQSLDYEEDAGTETTMYPPASYRPMPRWLSGLAVLGQEEVMLRSFIDEIYIALRNKCLRLAVMGIRALLERVMIAKVGDQGTFKANIDAFEQKGFISASQRRALEPVLEAGHAAIHRAFDPTPGDVSDLMDITESVIEAIYVNDHKAAALIRRVPVRLPRSKASP